MINIEYYTFLEVWDDGKGSLISDRIFIWCHPQKSAKLKSREQHFFFKVKIRVWIDPSL